MFRKQLCPKLRRTADQHFHQYRCVHPCASGRRYCLFSISRSERDSTSFSFCLVTGKCRDRCWELRTSNQGNFPALCTTIGVCSRDFVHLNKCTICVSTSVCALALRIWSHVVSRAATVRSFVQTFEATPYEVRATSIITSVGCTGSGV